MSDTIGDRIAYDYAHSYCIGDCANAIDDAIAPLIEALEYYANPDTWKLLKDSDENGYIAVMPKSWFSDRGTTAINALKGIKHENVSA